MENGLTENDDQKKRKKNKKNVSSNSKFFMKTRGIKSKLEISF